MTSATPFQTSLQKEIAQVKKGKVTRCTHAIIHGKPATTHGILGWEEGGVGNYRWRKNDK